MIFGLRMNAGVDVGEWQARCPDVPWAAVESLLERLVGEEFAVRAGSVVKLTDRGRLVADSVGVEVMEAFASEESVV